ncbi:MAG: LapA family protein [Alphaproteobacteria bacterium]
MKNFRYWLVIVVAGIVILFTLQNTATVEVNFLLWTLSLPGALLLFVLFGAGILVGLLMARVQHRRHDDPR